MKWSDLRLRLRALRSRQRAEAEMDEELSFHLEMNARKNRTRADFGGLEQVREECRDARGLTLLENLWRDVRYGARMLRKSPVFTVVATLSLAIGIGANTAVFTLVDAVLLRSLPVKSPEQLAVLQWGSHKSPGVNSAYSNGGGGATSWTTNVVSWRTFREMRDHSRTLGSVFGFSQMPGLNVAANGQTLVTGGLSVSGNYFTSLGVGMAAGRPLLADNDTANGTTAAVISYGLWERAFGLDAGAIGKSITVNGQLCTVVGVTPKGFSSVSNGGWWLTPKVELTLPIRARDLLSGTARQRIGWFTEDLHWVQVMGRLPNPGARAAAESELAGLIAANAAEETKRAMASDPPQVKLLEGSQGLSMLREQYQKPLLILFTVVALTLLMACTNLAGLLLARAAARRKEILIRLATGAKRSRLVGQLLIEGALLALLGTAAGLLFAYWGVGALLALVAAGPHPMVVEAHPDLRVLAFTILVAGVTTFFFALAPALRATRVDVAHGLKEDTAATSGGRFGAVRVLVAVQVAVALLLLAGATLFERTLTNLRSVNLGFNARNLVVFDIAPGKNGYSEERGAQLYQRIVEKLRQLPGAGGATLVQQRLVDGAVSNSGILVEGSASRQPSIALCNYVGPDYFAVMQIPLIAGRAIEGRDMAATPRVAVISESAARKYFDGAAVGRRFRWSAKKEWDVEVVGVVKDAVYDRVRREPSATVYAPYSQMPRGWPAQLSVAVRTGGSQAEAIAGVRRAMGELDRALPLVNLKTMETQIDDTLSQERLFASLVSWFGAITLALACVGLYGLVASSVTSRTREIGVRMALGAGRGAVLRMVMRQVVLTATAGVAMGIPATWALTKVIESQLFGVKAHDPVAIAAAGGGVLAMALLAAAWPARRALRIDPVRALRWE